MNSLPNLMVIPDLFEIGPSNISVHDSVATEEVDIAILNLVAPKTTVFTDVPDSVPPKEQPVVTTLVTI